MDDAVPASTPRRREDTPEIFGVSAGEVAEWSNAPHSKCGIRASVSGVRIPPSPPDLVRFYSWLDAVAAARS